MLILQNKGFHEEIYHKKDRFIMEPIDTYY